MSYPQLERRLYRERHGNGLLDLFIGVALAVMGGLWLTDVAGLAGVFPALLVPLWMPLHRRLIEPRTGRADPTPDRRRRERTTLIRLAALGSLTFGAGIGLFLWSAERGSPPEASFVAGLPALLLALGAFASAWWFGLPRLAITGGLLIVGAVVVIVRHLNPGFALLGSGIVVLVLGATALTRFLSTPMDR